MEGKTRCQGTRLSWRWSGAVTLPRGPQRRNGRCPLDQGGLLPGLGGLWLRFKIRDCADHELVKEGHGESDVAVGGAVDHAFLDELGAHRAEAGDLDAEGFGDVASALGAGAEVSDGAEEVLFAGGEAVEPDAEEVLVQAGNGRGRGGLDDGWGDGAGRGQVPSLVAPFLQEIWIAAGEAEDFGQGWFLEDDACGLGGVGFGERADLGKVEKPLGAERCF